MSEKMIVDAHVHLFSDEVRNGRERFCRKDRAFAALYASPKARMASPREVLDALDEAGARGAVVLGFPWREVEMCRAHNDFIVEACAASGGRLVGLGCIHPDAGEQGLIEAERALGLGLQGIGELAAYGHEGLPVGASFFEELSGLLRTRGRPLLLHATEPVGHPYPGKDRTDLHGLYQWILAHPDLDLILAHWGGGLFFYELMPEVKAACRRVYYDTAASPFLYRSEIYGVALQIIGTDRILMGSDFPLMRPRRLIEEVRSQGLSFDAISAILGGNAARLWSWSQGA